MLFRSYLRYMKKALASGGNDVKAAFAKIGLLMASAGRSSQPLHPTNLHVNKSLYPEDTVQSKLPDPGWLEHWLDSQIHFDKAWEKKVIDMILLNLSKLFGRPIKTLQELNRFRRELRTPAPATAA